MPLPSINLSRRAKIILACALVFIWIATRQQISQMDGWFFQPSIHGAKGLVLYLIGDYSGAAKAYRAQYREGFETGVPPGTSASEALLRGDLKAARETATLALQTDPDSRDALLTLGELSLDEGSPVQALAYADQVLQKETDDPDALILASLAHAHSGDHGKAIDALNRTLRHSSIGSRLTAFLMFLENTGDKARLPDKEKPLCLVANYYRYLRIYDESNGRLAIAYAEKAIAAGDRPADAYLAMGIVYEKQGKRDQALTAFLNAVEHDPRHAEAYRWAATIYSYRGDLANEYLMWMKGYEVAPEDPKYAMGMIAFLQEKLGDLPRALEVALKTAERGTEDTSILRTIGGLYKTLGEEDHAVEFYNRARLLRPDDVEILVEIGMVHIESGKYTEAQAIFQSALSVNSSHPAPHLGLAGLYHQQRRFREAISETEAAIRLGAWQPNVRAQLCSLYEWDGRHQQAEDCLRIVLRQDPSNQMAKNLLPYVQKNLTPEKFR